MAFTSQDWGVLGRVVVSLAVLLDGILDFNPTYERVFEQFEISPRVFLASGEYRSTRFKWQNTIRNPSIAPSLTKLRQNARLLTGITPPWSPCDEESGETC